MIYLNEKHITQIGIDWENSIKVIKKVVECINENDFVQPIKPYLRFRDLNNRIIAMPAFVGKDFNIAGIKWIASFPKNIDKNIPRAHSVIILNNADTGEVISIINTTLLSILRTASVSGLIIKQFNKVKPLRRFNLGIIGWGPIGQYHFEMVTKLFGNKISNIYIYDLRKIDEKSINSLYKNKVKIVKNWEEAYNDADIFITCTVSKAPYVDKKPKEGSLILNVSLRDFKTEIYDYVKNGIVVDSWDEVCREKTDIETLHREKGLQKDKTQSIVDVVCNNSFQNISSRDTIMFNPMGMAVFDIAMGVYYLRKAQEKNIGLCLE